MKKARQATAGRKKATEKKERITSKVFWPYGTILFAALLFVDQYTKRTIINAYPLGASHKIIPGLWFSHMQNTGAIWSTFQNQNGLLIWISVIALGLLVFFYDQFKTTFEKIAYTLLLAGLWGNMLDRALLGYVVDFIDLRWWPVFNIADSCIVIGITIFLLEQIRQERSKLAAKASNK